MNDIPSREKARFPAASGSPPMERAAFLAQEWAGEPGWAARIEAQQLLQEQRIALP